MVRPEAGDPTRTPSIRNSVWSDSVPRRNSVDSLPSPPWLTRVMPARPRSSSGSERALLASICARSITSTAASAASAVVAVRVAVTTTLSRSVASSPCASAGPGSASASASGLRRKTVSRWNFMFVGSPARTPARPGMVGDGNGGAETRTQADAGARAGPRDALRIAIRHACGRSPGSRAAHPSRDVPLRRLPMRMHSGRCRSCRAYRCGGSAGLEAPSRFVTGFPFQPAEHSARSPQARAL